MRKALLAAVIGLLPVQCVPTYAQTVGENVTVLAMCMHKERVEWAVTEVSRTGSYDKINENFVEGVKAGVCVELPHPVQVPIAEIGLRGPVFVDEDGDRLRYAAIRVGHSWTLYMEMIAKGGKT